MLPVRDTQGYNDVGFQTPNYAVTHTPNLDYLAKGGVVFTNHHVQPFCSPTRAALQTGRHVLRYGLQNTVIWPQDPWALPLNETFLSENLHDAGYYTAYFGKWVRWSHLIWCPRPLEYTAALTYHNKGYRGSGLAADLVSCAAPAPWLLCEGAPPNESWI